MKANKLLPKHKKTTLLKKNKKKEVSANKIV